ncbi:MAG TPA: glycosyltransferase family 2 protein [Candidatus Saccharimonadales bacterium]|nr:glycosyltransferase family 2 protein [Candidatus Saccharimonadales bacterium]
MANKKLISVIIPIYNEAENLPTLYEELSKHINRLPYDFEVLLVDDGSKDDSAAVACNLAEKHESVKVVQLARNFGKEAAVSAGFQEAKGDAAIVMDADLQMPPRLIGKFLQRWEGGSEVVIGVFAERNMSALKKLGAKYFYRIMNGISSASITPNATDFRLLDREVIDAFNSLTEHNRITRGMIDWLGFKRSYIYFKQEPRLHGEPTYGYRKLFQLAINSFTGYSMLPLKLAGYLGICILMLSIPAGLFMYVEQYILNDPMQLLISGTDMLAIMIVFLVGVVLACLGLIALYIAHIHDEVANRPVFITRKRAVADAQQVAEEREGELRLPSHKKEPVIMQREAIEG